MSSLLNKLKKLSFFTHYPRETETITIDNVTETFPSKKSKWGDEWFSDYYINGNWYIGEPYTIIEFTGTEINLSNAGNFKNSIIDWGDGVIQTTQIILSHTQQISFCRCRFLT